MKFLTHQLYYVFCFALAFVSSQANADSAPDFDGIAHWINTPPLTMHQLRGKVTLIDFWAYSCINCIRTFPHLNYLYRTYKNKGLVIVGVHTPEFDFEKNQANVAKAVKQFSIHYPVAMDNDMATWNAWHNLYWPAEYLVDKHGQVVAQHYGEGNYLAMENAIRHLLKLPTLSKQPALGITTNFSQIGSPEMYFGSARQQYLASPESGRNGTRHFSAPSQLSLNQFALIGQWKISDENAMLVSSQGELRLRFQAAKLNIVANSKQQVTLLIKVDGHQQPPVTIHSSKLYNLFNSNDYREHTVSIHIPSPGLTVYTFTFG